MLTEKSRKIIITGQTRAGTALLVELLTELGLDTGCAPRSRQHESVGACKPGTDQDLEAVSAPYIVKNSKLAAELPAILARGHVTIDYAFVPIRQRDETATVQNGTSENIYTLIETLAAHDIPNTFLHFPRFAHDVNYTFAKLRPLLRETTREEFAACFARVAKPDVVRAILEGQPDGKKSEGPAAHSARITPRFFRHALQFAAACSFMAIGWTAASWNDAEKTSIRPTAFVNGTPRVAAIERPPLGNFPLPSFRSQPLRLSESLSLAAMDLYPERTFPSRFGPMNMLNRPPQIDWGFRREALNHFLRR